MTGGGDGGGEFTWLRLASVAASSSDIGGSPEEASSRCTALRCTARLVRIASINSCARNEHYRRQSRKKKKKGGARAFGGRFEVLGNLLLGEQIAAESLDRRYLFLDPLQPRHQLHRIRLKKKTQHAGRPRNASASPRGGVGENPARRRG